MEKGSPLDAGRAAVPSSRNLNNETVSASLSDFHCSTKGIYKLYYMPIINFVKCTVENKFGFIFDLLIYPHLCCKGQSYMLIYG